MKTIILFYNQIIISFKVAILISIYEVFPSHYLWIETNAIFYKSYASNCFKKCGLISTFEWASLARHCFNDIFNIPIRYADAIVAPIYKTEQCTNTFPPWSRASLMNLFVNLKNFFASYSVVFLRSTVQYLKYWSLFVYYLQVTFNIWVIPVSIRCLALRPVTKFPKYSPGMTYIG